MKSNATAYDVNPRKIVVGGGSAGAHLALLAAYTGNKHLVPDDLEKIDLSVHAVVSFYGQSDLSATYYHTCQHLVTRSALAEKKKGEEGVIRLFDHMHYYRDASRNEVFT